MTEKHIGTMLRSHGEIFCWWCVYWIGRYGPVMNGCEVPCTLLQFTGNVDVGGVGNTGVH